MHPRRYFIFLLNLVLIFLMASCATNPVTGKKEIMFYSEEGELSLGKTADRQIKSTYGLYSSPQLESYLSGIAARLIPHTHRPHLPYRVTVLDTPVVNAFAIPGGYVYLTRGILALIGSEAELAAIIGHELGHINARHSLRRMSGMILLNLGLAVGSALNEDIARISGLANIGLQLLYLKFSRQDEYQADSLGVRYTRAGGYDPGEMIGFFTVLQQMKEKSGGGQLPTFLSTHPLTASRITEVTNMLEPQDARRSRSPQRYCDQLGGLVVGEDPRSGFFQGNRFYHPELALVFSYPQSWKTQNTPRQVILSEPRGKAAMVLGVQRTEAELAAYLNQQVQSLEIQRQVSRDSGFINRFPAVNGIYDLNTDSGTPIRIMITCLRKGPHIFSFLSLASQQDFAGYHEAFQSTLRSFSALRDRKVLNLQPRRLQIIQADGTRSWRHYLQAYRVPSDDREYLSLINRLKPEDIPPENTRLKIIR